MTESTVTYDAPLRTTRGVELQTITRAGERYRGWIIDYEPAERWRIVHPQSGQVLIYNVITMPVARRLVDILQDEFDIQVVEDKIIDGVQTYKGMGLTSIQLWMLCSRAEGEIIEAQTAPGPAEFDPTLTAP